MVVSSIQVAWSSFSMQLELSGENNVSQMHHKHLRGFVHLIYKPFELDLTLEVLEEDEVLQ